MIRNEISEMKIQKFLNRQKKSRRGKSFENQSEEVQRGIKLIIIV